MKALALTLFCLVFYNTLGNKNQDATSEEKVSYAGYQVYAIKNADNQTLSVLKELEQDNYIDLRKTPTAVFIVIHYPYKGIVLNRLVQERIQHQIAISDVQQLIDAENVKTDEDITRQNNTFSYNYYHKLEDFYSYLLYLSQNYPKLCTLKTIGRSAEGKPIQLLKISNGKPKNKAIFLESGIHASEWIGSATAMYIIDYIVHNHRKEPEFIRNVDWYVVPMLNPDGYVYAYTVDRFWRKNRNNYGKCKGVDLNRNWSYLWNTNGSSTDSCSRTFRGEQPFSEPETAAIAKFFKKNHQIQWISYISLHSYGQYIAYPWAAPSGILKDYEDLQFVGTQAALNIASAGGKSYTVGPAGPMIHYASGSSMDWARGAQSIKYSYTIELPDNGLYGVILPAKFIRPSSDEGLIAVKTIAQSAYFK